MPFASPVAARLLRPRLLKAPLLKKPLPKRLLLRKLLQKRKLLRLRKLLRRKRVLRLPQRAAKKHRLSNRRFLCPEKGWGEASPRPFFIWGAEATRKGVGLGGLAAQ